MSLNKKDLVLSLATNYNLTQSEAAKQVDQFVNSILELTAENDTSLRIRGFGCFSRKLSAPRKGRNPQTGQTLDIPAKSVLRFKPSNNL